MHHGGMGWIQYWEVEPELAIINLKVVRKSGKGSGVVTQLASWNDYS